MKFVCGFQNRVIMEFGSSCDKKWNNYGHDPTGTGASHIQKENW